MVRETMVGETGIYKDTLYRAKKKQKLFGHCGNVINYQNNRSFLLLDSRCIKKSSGSSEGFFYVKRVIFIIWRFLKI